MEGFGMSCIKFLLFAFNFLFVIGGLVLIIAGGLVLRYNNYNLLDGDTQGPTIGLIVIGVFIFITAFLGCCGALKENYCMLITFSIILLLIFIVQVAMAITAAVYKDNFKDELGRQLNESIKQYGDNELTRRAWDEVQRDFECCGINGPEDYRIGTQLPASCCASGDPSTEIAHQTCLASQVAYRRGCYQQLEKTLQSGLLITMGIAIGISYIELVGAILACILAKNISSKDGEVA